MKFKGLWVLTKGVSHIVLQRKGGFKPATMTQSAVQDMISSREAGGVGNENLGHAILIAGAARQKGGVSAGRLDDSTFEWVSKELSTRRMTAVAKLQADNAADLAAGKKDARALTPEDVAALGKKLDALIGSANMGNHTCARPFTYLAPDKQRLVFLEMLKGRQDPKCPNTDGINPALTAAETTILINAVAGVVKFDEEWRAQCAPSFRPTSSADESILF